MEKKTAMTNREFFEAVIVANLSEEMTEKAEGFIKSLDKANARRKETPKVKERNSATIALRNKVMAILAEGPALTTVLAEKTGESSQRISGIMRELVQDGKVVTEKVSVKGKGKQTQWSIAAEDGDEE